MSLTIKTGFSTRFLDMGVSTMVIYGIRVSDRQAKKVARFIEQYMDKEFYRPGPPDMHLYLFADGIDNKIHNGLYEPYYPHFFGINYATKGVFSNDEVAKALTCIPSKVIDKFDIFGKPFLKQFNIEKKPQLFIISQYN